MGGEAVSGGGNGRSLRSIVAAAALVGVGVGMTGCLRTASVGGLPAPPVAASPPAIVFQHADPPPAVLARDNAAENDQGAAAKAERAGNLDAAERYFEAALAIRPEIFENHIFLARLFARQKRWAATFREYGLAFGNPMALSCSTETDPVDMAYYGDACEKTGHLALAYHSFSAGGQFIAPTLQPARSSQDPSYRQAKGAAYLNAGVRFLQSGRMKRGIARLREAVAFAPANWQAHWQLGLVLRGGVLERPGLRQLDIAERLAPAYLRPKLDSQRVRLGRTGMMEMITNLNGKVTIKVVPYTGNYYDGGGAVRAPVRH